MGLETNEAKAIIECLLFVAGEALAPAQIASILGISERETQWLIGELQGEYESTGRGLSILSIANGYRIFTRPQYAAYIEKLQRETQRSSLSYAALETLAIIAYKQPVTRSEVDAIRGVQSDRTINTLVERQLIREAGRRDTVGRPMLFATTDFFLDSFGLGDLAQLPGVGDLAITEDEEEPS
jgi:segregation and condensation protein B